MHLVPTQQAGFQLELFSMAIHEEITVKSLWQSVPARALVLLREQPKKIQARAIELINRNFEACAAMDIRETEEHQIALFRESIDEAYAERKEPQLAKWYEDIPQEAFDNFLRRYDQYTSPIREAA